MNKHQAKSITDAIYEVIEVGGMSDCNMFLFESDLVFEFPHTHIKTTIKFTTICEAHEFAYKLDAFTEPLIVKFDRIYGYSQYTHYAVTIRGAIIDM